jgi:hypothetical protein
MLSSISALVLVLLPLVYAQDLDPNTVLSSLKSSKVIPDVIPAAANFTLRFPIEIVYTDKNNSHFPVTAGTNLTTNRSSPFYTSKSMFVHKLIQKPSTCLHSPFFPTTPKSWENHTSWL